MRAFVSTTVVAVACTVAVLAAQPGTPPGQSAQKPANVVTATGCVATGTGAGQYTLTDATLMPAAAMDNDKAPPAKGKMSADHAMTYLLLGGGDLKPHLGHKVAVTGTIVKPEMPKDTPPSERDKASRPMSGGSLNVTSVKMVAATCP